MREAFHQARETLALFLAHAVNCARKPRPALHAAPPLRPDLPFFDKK